MSLKFYIIVNFIVNRELHTILVNLTKIFHSVGRDNLWKVLKELSNPDKILRVALFFYKDMETYVISVGEKSKLLALMNGTKQCLLYFLFLITLFYLILH